MVRHSKLPWSSLLSSFHAYRSACLLLWLSSSLLLLFLCLGFFLPVREMVFDEGRLLLLEYDGGQDPIPVFVVVSVVASSSRWQKQQENGIDHEAPNQVFWNIKGTTMCAKGTTTCRGIQRSWTTHHLQRRRWRRRRWWRIRQGSTQKLKTNNNKESLVPEQWTWWGHDCCINTDGTSGRYTLNILSPLQISFCKVFCTADLLMDWSDMDFCQTLSFCSALQPNLVDGFWRVGFASVFYGGGFRQWQKNLEFFWRYMLCH